MKTATSAGSASRKAAVLTLLSDGNWHSTYEVNQVGGTDGTRRLREIRQDRPIEAKQIDGSAQWQYRMTPLAIAALNSNHASL